MAAGFGLAKPEHKAEVSFTPEQILGVKYANSDEDGAIEHWIHCGACKQGVVRKDGKCSYCGKGLDEQPKNN